MQTLVIKEGVLNDDKLHIADTNKVFGGGFVAILEQFTYANEWSNKHSVRSFRKMDTLYKYLDKNYPGYDSDTLVFQA
jgi:hypothetical protein